MSDVPDPDTEVPTVVGVLIELAGAGPVLDAAAATGRLAVPLAQRGVPVVATDASPDMLARLRAKDTAGLVETRVEVLPDIGGREKFSLIAILANSLWVMTSAERQAAFLRTAAGRLLPAGRLVVEQHEINPAGYQAGVQREADGLRFVRRSRYNPRTQRLVHQFTVVTPDGRARSRNVYLRATRVAELIDQAGRAGLELEHAWRSWEREPYTPGDNLVIAVFRAPS